MLWKGFELEDQDSCKINDGFVKNLLEGRWVTQHWIFHALLDDMKVLEPYGYGNPKPLICLTNLTIVKKYPMGKEQSHLKLMVKGNGVELLQLVLFNCFDDVQKLSENDEIDVIGYPNINIWNGNETIQFQVKEWRYSKEDS